jgi:membrane protease YdiL (CAAX protease family)
MNRSLLPRPRFWAEAFRQRRNRFGLFGEILVFMLVFFVSEMIQATVASIPATLVMFTGLTGDFFSYTADGRIDLRASVDDLLLHMPPAIRVILLFAAAAMGVCAMFYCAKIEKRKIRTMGLCGEKPWLEYLTGLAAGLVLFGAVTAIGHFAGGWQVKGFRSLKAGAVGMLALYFVGFLIQGASEELMFRGYLATSIGARAPAPLALIVSSVIFALFHTGNNGFTFLSAINTLLVGLVLGAYMIKRGSLWGVCGLHAMWNFAQGCVFGFPVSGTQTGYSMVDVTVRSNRSLLTGGDYGPEASAAVTVVLLAALGVVLALRAKDPAPIQVPAEDAPQDFPE